MLRTDIGGLDHAHVVSSVTDTAYPLLRIMTNEPRNVCLLRRRASTGDNGGELGRNFDKLGSENIEAELVIDSEIKGVNKENEKTDL